jgi:hypothetical protein
MKKYNRIKAAWPFVMVTAVITVGLCQVATMTFTRNAAAGPKSARRTIRLTLHGSTPTMAWSPDSKRLAANAAYEYYGFRSEVSRNKSGLGVYVVTLKTGRSKRITANQGYHPLWINNNTVAWGHSPYEDGTPGLYIADLRRNKVKRLGKYKGVYHTLFSTKRRILFYSGWPEYKRWVLADVRTGRLKKVRVKRRRRRRPPARPPSAKGSWVTPPGVSSWAPPAGKFKSQCLQKVGKVTAGASKARGVWLVTKTQTVQLAPNAYMFYNYGGSRCSVGAVHCGAVKPCVSPNGRYVAFPTHAASTGNYQLNILPVP